MNLEEKNDSAWRKYRRSDRLGIAETFPGTNHRFLRCAAKGNGNPFPENGTGAAFQDFSKSTYLRPYCRKNYEIERKGILEGYREVIHGILGTEGNREPVLHFSEMLTDDALAYFVARDRGCAYAPMNGASINLGPRGRLFENSVEHQQAVRSGVPCFAGFTLFQFSRKPVEPEVIDSGLKPSHGLEIRNHFRNHGSSISRIHVQGVPQLEETEVDLCGNMLIIRAPSEDAHAACFSRHNVTGPHSYV